MDRSDRSGMAAREGDEVVIRLLDQPEALPEPRDRSLFELNDLPHMGALGAQRLISRGNNAPNAVS